MHEGLRNKRGFTLLELMATVGIIIILLGISVPAAHIMQQNLRFMKMNTVAKELYISSQNRLTHLKAAGQLNSQTGESNEFEQCFDTYSAQTPRNLELAQGKKPGDYTADDTNWEKLYYLRTDDSGLVSYALPSSVVSQLAGETGTYIIEVNPQSGDVYSVFYTEYQTASDLLDIYQNDVYDDRSKLNRKEFMIGYYSGNDAGSGIIPKSFEPKITVHNGEELYLQMECKDMIKYSTTFSYITVKITLSDQHGNQKVFSSDAKATSGISSVLTGGSREGTLDFELNGDVATSELLLDSMESGKSFREITGLYPGDTITAKASIVYSYHGKVISTDVEMEEAGGATFNSLFANGTDMEAGRIQVNRVRHLNNLRDSKFTIDKEQLQQDAEGNQQVLVEQTDDIDFDASTWANDEWMETPDVKTNPLTYFQPITSAVLFGSATTSQEVKGIATVQGNHNLLRNFDIGSSDSRVDNTGLFSVVNCDISGIRLENPSVYGASHTGALAGAVYGGKISECGAYLKPAGDQSQMDQMVKSRCVHGTGMAGALIGSMNAGTVERSFGALDVNKSENTGTEIGGLIGSAAGATVTDCYSSGEVSGDSQVGGLIGSAASTVVSGCYSTSNVGDESSDSGSSTYSGGLIGYISSGTVTNNISYGKITGAKSSCGAFTSGSSSASFSGNQYLYQNNYNEGYSDLGKSGISSGSYSDFRNLENSLENSHPYDLALSIFPFDFIDGIGEHYGNWPEEVSMDTALIYYECYKDGDGQKTYGYYARGYNKSNGSSKVNWTLDTLLDQDDLDENDMYVFEDGYAIMSVYDLVKMNYKLNSASGWTSMTRSQTDRDPYNDTISDFEQLENPRELQFVQDDGRYFTASYLYIFRLPFDLQMTSRNVNKNFYDKIELTGYAAGNTSESVFSDYTYYYNPHFSKNAMQMYDTSTGSDYYPDDPSRVAVRSARQLNALGRYVYYWNEDNFTKSISFTFEQELDLDFGKYTKTYCGVTFNLMDTSSSNKYKNIPIGETGMSSRTDAQGASYKPSSFSNTYEGNYHKIIDYCQETETSENYRFCGLFGEVQGSTIKNVRMIASDPENQSGYVICKFANSSYGTGSVAALVGLNYVSSASPNATVDNCSVSGYTIKYDRGTSNLVYHAAAGGLVGINMGTLKNSSAVCKLVTIIGGSTGSYTAGIGGLAGSQMCGTMTNCYSGGNLEAAISGTIQVAGLATNVTTWKESSISYNYKATNCYSYATVNSIPSGTTLYGTAVQASNCYYLASGMKVTPTTVTGSTGVTYEQLQTLNLGDFTAGGATAETSYPWSQSLQGGIYPFPEIVTDDGILVHYGDWPEAEAEPEPDPEPEYSNAVTSGTFGVAKATKSGYMWPATTTYTYTYYTYDSEGNLTYVEGSSDQPEGISLPSMDGKFNDTYYCCFWIDLDGEASWKYVSGTGTPSTTMSGSGYYGGGWNSSNNRKSATFRVTKSKYTDVAIYDSETITVTAK